MNDLKFHINFTFNGRSFKSVEELLSFSKSISLEVFSFLNDWFDPNDIIVVKTSGSTGNPTTIQLKKEYMVNSAIATGKYFDLQNNTKALLCLSPNYIAGKMMLVRALVLGWHLDVVKPGSNPLDYIKSTYDFCAMVPLQLSNSLSKLDHIKKLIVGGAAVSNDLIEKLQERSTEVYATYGMTETITHFAIKPLNIVNKTSLRGGTTWQSLNYKTLPDIKVTTDTRSCLIIDAPKVSDKQIVTNDVVKLISDTEFEWLGRYDTIINSGGVKLIPEQIENKLAEIINKRFFVAGVPDEVLGEKLVLIIENKNYDLIDEIASSPLANRNDDYVQNLKSHISILNPLHRYEVPKEIFIVKEFVETETKKIQRQLTLDLLNL